MRNDILNHIDYKKVEYIAICKVYKLIRYWQKRNNDFSCEIFKCSKTDSFLKPVLSGSLNFYHILRERENILGYEIGKYAFVEYLLPNVKTVNSLGFNISVLECDNLGNYRDIFYSFNLYVDPKKLK